MGGKFWSGLRTSLPLEGRSTESQQLANSCTVTNLSRGSGRFKARHRVPQLNRARQSHLRMPAVTIADLIRDRRLLWVYRRDCGRERRTAAVAIATPRCATLPAARLWTSHYRSRWACHRLGRARTVASSAGYQRLPEDAAPGHRCAQGPARPDGRAHEEARYVMALEPAMPTVKPRAPRRRHRLETHRRGRQRQRLRRPRLRHAHLARSRLV